MLNYFILFQVLSEFVDVFHGCMQEKIDENFEEKIENFAHSWLAADLPNSSKFHILKFHIVDFVKAVGMPLGKFGEQATETVHFDFGQTWERYKVPKSSDNYADSLKRAVVSYNSEHFTMIE